MEWGKGLFTLAETNIAVAQNCPFVDISSLIVDYFTPLQAVGFTFLVSWLNAVLIGMTIFTCNYLTNIKYLGISISAFMIVFSWFVFKILDLLEKICVSTVIVGRLIHCAWQKIF